MENKIDILLRAAVSKIGVREVGQNRGPEVEAFQKATGTLPGSAWCGCFAAWAHKAAGVNLGPKFFLLAAARNWFVARKIVSYSQVRPGDVFGVRFGISGTIRHVGIVLEVQGEDIVTVEGNTNDNGSRDGNGVYSKRRHKAGLVFARWV